MTPIQNPNPTWPGREAHRAFSRKPGGAAIQSGQWESGRATPHCGPGLPRPQQPSAGRPYPHAPLAAGRRGGRQNRGTLQTLGFSSPCHNCHGAKPRGMARGQSK